MTEPDPLEVLGPFIRPLSLAGEAERYATYQSGRAGVLTPEMIRQAIALCEPRPEPGTELGLWFDRDGHPIGPLRWQMLLQDDAYRCVAEHWVKDWRVSTVWTGMDGSHMPPSMRKVPPLIYETKIFGPGGGTDGSATALRELMPGLRLTADQARAAALAAFPGAEIHYATADEALAGHDEALHCLVLMLGAHPWQVQTWEQYSGEQWEVTAGGYRLVIRDGAIRGLVPAIAVGEPRIYRVPPPVRWAPARDGSGDAAAGPARP